MSDVAVRARVDASTVSRALNPATRHRVSPGTVARVLAAAEGLGYRMNTIARGLRLDVTMAVGMVIPDISNPFFPPIVRGVEDTLARAGRSLILMNTDDELDREAAAIEQLIERHVDALILATTHLANRAPAAADGIPCVLVNRVSRSRTTPSVVPDDRRGIRLALRHLVRLGHRRIAHIAGPQNTSTGFVRRREFERACASFRASGEIYEASAFTQDAGMAAAAMALKEGTATALVAANDLMAIGCLRTAAEVRLRVPEDLSVVGYDDMPLVDLLRPPLTTVRVPQYRMGQEAARLVVAVTGPGAESRRIQAHIRLTPELVVRGSTAAPSDVASRQARKAVPETEKQMSDAAWAYIAPVLLEGQERGGRWRDHRQVVEAVAWRSRTGKPWRALPEHFGPWQTAWKRFDRWNADGTWTRLKLAAGNAPELAAELDWLASIPDK